MILSPFAFSAHENPPHAYKGFKWQVFIYIQFSVMNNFKWFHVKYQIHLETPNEEYPTLMSNSTHTDSNFPY